MSQFVLCIPETAHATSAVKFREIAPADSFLREAAKELFAEERLARIPFTTGGGSFADLFTDAHNVVYNGGDFLTTRLSIELPGLLPNCKSVAFWWGNEWRDLPMFDSESDVIAEIVRQLCEPVGEVNLYFGR